MITMIVSFLLINSFSIYAFDKKRWKQILPQGTVTWYYDPISVFKLPNGNLKIWTAAILSPEMKKLGIDRVESLIELDCTQRKNRSVMTQVYPTEKAMKKMSPEERWKTFKAGKRDEVGKWKEIEPEFIFEILYRLECKRP
jgi:hypothetical protein